MADVVMADVVMADEAESDYKPDIELSSGSASDSEDASEPSFSIPDILSRCMVSSKFEKTPMDFIPRDKVDDFFTHEILGQKDKDGIVGTILRQLSPDATQASRRDRDIELVDYIVKRARVLFIIVCFHRHERKKDAMSLFKKAEYHDALLPFDSSVEEDEHPLRQMEDDHGRRTNRIWTDSRIREFIEAQWKFYAPVIKTQEQIHDFGRCTLPFVHESIRLGTGAFGTVTKYEVHPAHFEDPLESSQFSPRFIAVKELRKSEKVASQWQNEVEALSRMNGLGKKHIVRFLTAFRRGTSDDFEHYLVFEWADGGNLGDLWKTKVKPEPSVALVKWVVEQLHGLAEALTAAHYLPEIDGEHHGASYRHGDLKPENILWFREGGEFGTLKIGDWGEAKEHHEVTAVRHSTTTQTATLRYQPPEVVTGLQSTLNAEAKHVRSRLYDIWGFGCITLEFIIWLLHGEAGRKQFNKEGRGQLGYSDQFYEINSDGIASVHGAVIYWMDRMAKDNRCLPRRTAIGDLLEVVRQGLLVVKLPHDGGTIHPSDSLAPVLGHQNTTYVTTQTDEDTMQPEIAGEIPFVKVEQAKALDSGSPVARVGGVERLRATELHEHLGDILGSKQDGNYWSSGPSAMPIPDFSKVSKGHLASPSAQQPGKAGLRVPPLSPVDYGNPKLDPNNWSFVVDNTFASKFFSNSPAISSIPQHSEQSLCAKCREFCKGIRKPLFAISYGVGTLRRYAEANDCVLCWLLWKINEEHHLSTKFNTVQLVRRGSSLKSKSKEHPVISLFRSNASRAPATDIQQGFPELPGVGSPLQFRLLCEWLDDCDKKHSKPRCKPPGPAAGALLQSYDSPRKIPTRLVDVGCEDGEVIRLVETGNRNTYDWVALSYRWGPAPHFSTTQKNLPAHLSGINWEELPATFRDAVKVTRALKRRYLWIDSLCIIQGEDGDFSHESKLMEDVYSGAYCVLAASRATGQASGFLLPRPKQRRCVALAPQFDGDSVIYVCERIENFKEHVLEGALSQRAWVLQEHALARRTIFFTEHQTYWQCGHGVRCETMAKMNNAHAALLGDPEFPRSLDPAKHGDRIIHCQELYQRYSRLGLTNDYDRPTAIKGLQQRLLRTMNIRGGYGIFYDREKDGLVRRSLLWHRGSGIASLRHIDFPKEHEVIPSWSWMGVSGGIDYFSLKFDSFDWNKIHSPWSDPPNTTAITELVAELHEFSQASESHIILDIPGDPQEEEMFAIVLGTEKRYKGADVKSHYILVVASKKKRSLEGHLLCKRIGAGYLPGRLLTSTHEMCSLV